MWHTGTTKVPINGGVTRARSHDYTYSLTTSWWEHHHRRPFHSLHISLGLGNAWATQFSSPGDLTYAMKNHIP